MADDFACCPICMDDYDLDKRLPKSLDCRHSLCKSCLLNKGRPLRRCPSCRQNIDKPRNAANDLTMIDYLERKQQKRREGEQTKLREGLRNLLETISKELRAAEGVDEDQKRSTVKLTRKKKKSFCANAIGVVNKTSTPQNENKQAMSKMASVNREQPDARIQSLHEKKGLIMSMLQQSYINQEEFNRCKSETHKIIQSKATHFNDSVENMWNVYRDCPLNDYVEAATQTPSNEKKFWRCETPKLVARGVILLAALVALTFDSGAVRCQVDTNQRKIETFRAISDWTLSITRPVGVIEFPPGVMNFKRIYINNMTMDHIGSLPGDFYTCNFLWLYRVFAEAGDKVFVVNTKDMILYGLHVQTKVWEVPQKVDTIHAVQYAAMAFCSGRLYITGGETIGGKSTEKSMISLNVDKEGKSSVSAQTEPDMKYRRSEHSMVCVDGKVVVCGGMDDSVPLATCEVFDPVTAHWSYLTDLPKAGWAVGLIHTDTAMFVAGGATQYFGDDHPLILSDTVAMYNWQTGKWIILPHLPFPLAYVHAVYRGGSLWVLGAISRSGYATHCSQSTEYILEYSITEEIWIKHFKHPGNWIIDPVSAFIFKI